MTVVSHSEAIAEESITKRFFSRFTPYVNKLKITITVLLVIFLSLFAYFFQDIFKIIENRLIDVRSYLSTDGGLYGSKFSHADKDIIIVSVNDLTQYEAARSTELNLTRWPWSRVVWAKLINFIERQNPKVLVVDLNFSNSCRYSRLLRQHCIGNRSQVSLF